MFFATVPALRSRTVYTPYSPSLRALDRSLERYMQHAFSAPSPVKSEGEAGKSDDKAYSLSLDLPGVSKEQLDIQIEANQVRIGTKPEAGRRYSAAYEFASEIDAAASEAKLENGVLTLKLVKLAPVSKALSLAVN